MPEFEVVSREEWGAAPPKPDDFPLRHPIKHVMYTYTGTEECHTKEECYPILQKLQKAHMDEKGYHDIQYNFLIGVARGIIFEGRGWHVKSPKPASYFSIDARCLLVAYIGNYPTPPATIPTIGMFNSGCEVLQIANKLNYLDFDDLEIIPMKELTDKEIKLL